MLLQICFLACIAAPVLGDTSKSCPGGYRNGDTYENGRYWYACDNGQRVSKGCLSDNGGRVDVGSTFDTTDYRMQCIMGGDGYLSIIFKSCVSGGREYDINQRWDDGSTWYQCVKDGAAVRKDPVGCASGGRTLEFGERAINGDYVYTCKKGAYGKTDMIRSGCAVNGRKYNIGEQFDGDKVWYTCTDQGPQVVGCLRSGLRLKDGDTWHEDDIMYQCKVDDGRTKGIAFGCIARLNGVEEEKKLGCFWTEGDLPYQTEMTCVYDSASNRAKKVPTKCQYKASGGSFNVSPGCYQLAGGIAVGCIKESSDRLTTKVFSSEKPDSSYGLRQC